MPVAVDEVVQQAFATWASHTSLTFRQVSGPADINIAFVKAAEEYKDNFKSGLIFGYAYTPPRGAVYINADWEWSIRNSSGVSYRMSHVLFLCVEFTQ
jgi:hypothetical protein